MGVIGRVIRYVRFYRFQSKILAKTQSRDWLTHLTSGDTDKMQKSMDEEKNLFARFIRFSLEDPEIVEILQGFNKTPADLEGVYATLLRNGGGQVAAGHYIPLATMYMPEPLLYFLERERRGDNPQETAYNLIAYFENVRRGSLLARLEAGR